MRLLNYYPAANISTNELAFTVIFACSDVVVLETQHLDEEKCHEKIPKGKWYDYIAGQAAYGCLVFGHGVELAPFFQHDRAQSYRVVGTSCLFRLLQSSCLSQMTSSWLCPQMVSLVGFLSRSRIQTTTSIGIFSSTPTRCYATNAQRMSGLASAYQGPAERQYCAQLTGIACLPGTLALIRHTCLSPMHTTSLISLQMCALVQCALLPKVRISCEWVQSPSRRFRCNHSPVGLWI